MTYASWEPRYRVTTVAPGRLDIFVLTLIDGKRATLDPITEYEDALAKARAFVRDHPCQIKVLPVTGPEARNMLGVALSDSAATPMDSADRKLVIDTLMLVARESNDPETRGDALKLLAEMGQLPA